MKDRPFGQTGHKPIFTERVVFCAGKGFDESQRGDGGADLLGGAGRPAHQPASPVGRRAVPVLIAQSDAQNHTIPHIRRDDYPGSLLGCDTSLSEHPGSVQIVMRH